MKNVHITDYANFAYFDLELHDLDPDPRSHDIYYTVFVRIDAPARCLKFPDGPGLGRKCLEHKSMI